MNLVGEINVKENKAYYMLFCGKVSGEKCKRAIIPEYLTGAFRMPDDVVPFAKYLIYLFLSANLQI